MDKLQ
jgi:Leucine-rich repeat (LRR) protein